MTCLSLRLFAAVCGLCVLSVTMPRSGFSQQREPPSGVARRVPTTASPVDAMRARTMFVASTAITPAQDSMMQPKTHRGRHALIGGALGGIAAVGTCYYLLGTNSDNGDSTRCRPLGAVMFGGAGFGIGALIGSLFP